MLHVLESSREGPLGVFAAQRLEMDLSSVVEQVFGRVVVVRLVGVDHTAWGQIEAKALQRLHVG
jgi:hypothetical protein